MAATLAEIDAALYAALTPLLTDQTTGITDARPFATVSRYVGELTQEALQQAGATFPACLLRFDGEASDRDVSTIGGDTEERGRAQWTVAVAVEDPRAADDLIQGATGVPGALTLAGQVLARVNALLVSDSWRWRRVRYVDTRPVLARPGVAYVLALRFEAFRAVEQATTTQASTPLTGVRGDVNLTGTADTPPDPMVRFEADT